MLNCKFTSVWDDGSVVTTPCEYDPESGEVSPEFEDVEIEGALVREYITLEDDEELDVCMDCHSFVMKTVVGDREDESYGEMEVCSDPECERSRA